MLDFCTIQVFYQLSSFRNWDTSHAALQNLNLNLSFNFVMENLGDPNNRYIRANASFTDRNGVIPNFPFPNSKFHLVFLNCHVALLFSPPTNLLHVMWGMAAFNEDSDFLIIIDRYPGRIHWQFNYYFAFYSDFRLTSIILYNNVTSNTLSIVCHTCNPPQKITNQNDPSILLKKLIAIKQRTLPDFRKHCNQLIQDMHRHSIYFNAFGNRKFWGIPCSPRHCGLDTPPTSCPISELKIRLNFTTISSFRNRIGHAVANQIFDGSKMNEWFLMPGTVLRSSWLKHSITFRKLQYAIYALPMELNAKSLLRIFDVWTFFILTLFGSCFTVLIFMNRDFVFAPMMWAISIFLQQGTCIIIKLSEANKAIRLRVFITYVVILIWLFNAFFVGSIFGGEFYSLFTSNRVPNNIPSNMQELVRAKEIPIYSFLTTHIVVDENRKVSSLKELTIPSMLNAKGYSPEFRIMLNDLKARVEWSMGNKFEAALRFSLDKYFIISSSEGRLGSLMLPWVTPRNPFGVIFEEYLGYLTEAGITDMWEKNYQKFMTVDGVSLYHRHRVEQGVPEKNYTNYFQKVVFGRKESNSPEVSKEGDAIRLVDYHELQCSRQYGAHSSNDATLLDTTFHHSHNFTAS
ncbi:hypothetical protein Fcan01_11506 [Folsomia candida]|uniref:Uncharacterized protein n=1 Tax=Folsomia candida TaxID=158441 RepID=A0A226EBR5_FOLCA|nr:hypothetical protein Fcan01_11506 [Folsomia candida]